MFLGTSDLKKTLKFYQDIMRLSLYKDQEVCLIFNIKNKSKIGFCEQMAVIYKDKSPIITFLTEDVIFSNDPNGSTIKIQKFLNT
ncbi:MAG: hypothetical protein ACFFDF_16275 [Candidatus Odinarchaeota archaeon]